MTRFDKCQIDDIFIKTSTNDIFTLIHHKLSNLQPKARHKKLLPKYVAGRISETLCRRKMKKTWFFLYRF